MARAQRSDAEAGDGYIPFLERFKGWWNGGAPPERVRKRRTAPNTRKPRETAPPQEQSGAPDPQAITVDEPSDTDAGPRWPDSRVDFCRRLWAVDDEDEMVEPGGAAYCADLLKPTAVDSSKAALDLSAGLGGGVRYLAKQSGLWMTGMEPDEELAERAHELSCAHGMARRAPITAYDPEKLRLPKRKYYVILMRERLYRVRDKGEALKTIRGALKPQGHLILADFALAQDSSAEAKAVTAWTALEPERPPLWTMEQYRRALRSVGVDLRVFEPDSERYRGLILGGWARLVDGLRREELTRPFVDNMMREAEYWVRLARALESGELVYLRAHCMRKGSPETG